MTENGRKFAYSKKRTAGAWHGCVGWKSVLKGKKKTSSLKISGKLK